MVDHETIWIIPVAGAILLVALDLSIQYAYKAYVTKRISIPSNENHQPDELVLRKLSKLIRFFSSPVVQFDCPREIRIGKKFTARLSMQLEDALEKVFKYDDDSKLSINPKIKATLSGNDFRFRLDSEIEQSIDGKNLVWTWSVLPLRKGHQPMAVHLNFLGERNEEVKACSMWLDERIIKVTESKLSAVQLWCNAKWKSAMAAGLEFTMFYFLLKYVIELGA